MSQTSSEPGPWVLSRREVAERLGCCPRTVANLVRRGLLPQVNILGRRGIDVEDLRRFIDANKTSLVEDTRNANGEV